MTQSAPSSYLVHSYSTAWVQDSASSPIIYPTNSQLVVRGILSPSSRAVWRKAVRAQWFGHG